MVTLQGADVEKTCITASRLAAGVYSTVMLFPSPVNQAQASSFKPELHDTGSNSGDIPFVFIEKQFPLMGHSAPAGGEDAGQGLSTGACAYTFADKANRKQITQTCKT